VRHRSIARSLIQLIQSRNLLAHVDILRPPTFDQLRQHVRPRIGKSRMTGGALSLASSLANSGFSGNSHN
jgi:hypothetical protein